MKNYKLVNNALGWLVFAIAAVVYLMTIEPTASFWDCGEFISSAYKLEVGHPPGNPIFMLTANLFTQLASDPTQVALMVNAMSAIFSALTILFLFWTITHLTRKIVLKDEKETMTLPQMIIIMGAGLVGSLAYTFSDTFWFSAVEGEVYAFSSLMTALVFWLILKWEDVADQPHADRWLILIAYLMGLSIAVHLLNLLCIPAIVLVYYFKKKPNPNLKGALFALLLSFAMIVLILYGLVQGLVEVCGWFELLFVNVLGMPYNSGVVFYVILIVAVLGWSIWETMREKQHPLRIKISFILAVSLLGIPFIGDGYVLGVLLIAALTAFLFYYKKVNPAALNTILISLLVITIGYSSYALIMIRSAANPPMDQNSPEDIFTLRTYLSREQYGETPLFYGQTFVSEYSYNPGSEPGTCVVELKDGGPVWSRIVKDDPSEKDRYFVSSHKEKPVYVDELNTLFPRMFDKKYAQAYKSWSNFKGKQVTYNLCGEPRTAMMPTFFENMKYFFSYQVNYMYWRYFMWNFAGRQNDVRGTGDIMDGNWITGIKFLDELRLGPQDNLPDDIVNNKAHNKYYMLPLLLGILGLLFQAYAGEKGIQGFWVTFLLFFMTGLAIVIYLNQTPDQPRERDYAYAGSFYAFCIWIGMGVAALAKGMMKYGKMPALASSCVAAFLCLLVPVQMVSQTWNDHNRSHRTVARDFGYNYLTTCAPNAIIYTNGDNDTFPLWYSQEVEGYRTDVRVCNLSYLQTDWYIDQMKCQAYQSAPLPIDWKRSEYTGKHDMARFIPRTDRSMTAAAVLDWIKSDDLRTKRVQGSMNQDHIPTYKITIPIDSAAVIAAGIVKPENAHWIPKEILLDFGEIRNEKGEVVEPAKRELIKNEIMILDMLKNNTDWTRPIYYASTVPSDLYMRLDDYFRSDGIAYRIVPYNTREHGQVDTDVLFDNMVNKYKWGGLDYPGVYLDETVLNMASNFRMRFGRLASALIKEGKTDKAKQALDYSLKVIPAINVPYNYINTYETAECYFAVGEKDKSIELFEELAARSMKNLRWFNRLDNSQYASVLGKVRSDMLFMNEILSFYEQNKPELVEKYTKEYNSYSERFFNTVRRTSVQGGRNQ